MTVQHVVRKAPKHLQRATHSAFGTAVLAFTFLIIWAAASLIGIPMFVAQDRAGRFFTHPRVTAVALAGIAIAGPVGTVWGCLWLLS